MTEVHVDIYGCINGGPLFFIGHGDVLKTSIPESASSVADLLHRLAWGFEEVAVGNQTSEEGVHPSHPRKVTSDHGDQYYEVAPDEFVEGMSYDDALETYMRTHESVSYQTLLNRLPKSTTEEL